MIAEGIFNESNLLWEEILDNSEWFVSPRGDRFSARQDTELGERGLESLTFLIDSDFPREHLVSMQFLEADEPFEFWLDIQRRLLDVDRRPLYADIRMREGFLNMVLKRLFSITGKLYGTYGGKPKPHGEVDVWGYMYKRAHYTILTSDPKRRIYTMQSMGARMHAEEIFADFGIDIYEETVRRRRMGRLRENQFLTFHRESNPDIPNWTPRPNDLSYNPDKVQEAIQNILAGRHPHPGAPI